MIDSFDRSIARLDQSAIALQKRWTRLFALTQVLGVAAAILALVPGRIGVAAAGLLLVIATVGTLVVDRLNMEAKWHSQRDLVEFLYGRKYRFCMGIAPYDGVPGPVRLIQDFQEHGVQAELDGGWLDTRSLPPREQLNWYAERRINLQLSFYRSRSTEFARSAKSIQLAIYLVYGVVLVVALLQTVGVLNVEIVGLLVACIASMQTWAAMRRWSHTATIYARTSQVLESHKNQCFAMLQETHIGRDELHAFVNGVEELLDGESSRWLSLNNFALFDSKRV